MLLRRRGVAEHVRRLEAAVTTSTNDLKRDSLRRSARTRPWAGPTLAVLVRGQTYRGHMRESFHIDGSSTESRATAQRVCMTSLMEQLVLPYERRGHRVDLFLTLYRAVGGSMRELLAPLGRRV